MVETGTLSPKYGAGVELSRRKKAGAEEREKGGKRGVGRQDPSAEFLGGSWIWVVAIGSGLDFLLYNPYFSLFAKW